MKKDPNNLQKTARLARMNVPTAIATLKEIELSIDSDSVVADKNKALSAIKVALREMTQFARVKRNIQQSKEKKNDSKNTNQ